MRLMISLLLVSCLCIHQAFAQDFLILGTQELPFKTEVNKQVQGIDVDIISLVMKELNVNYKIRLIASGSRVIREMQLGHADMALSFSMKEDRRAYFIYPRESYKDLTWNFFIRDEDKERIRFNTFSDLKGFTIGVTQDWSYTADFWKAGLTLDIITENRLQIEKLLKKRIDVVPMNTVSALYEAKQKGYLSDIAYLPKPLKSKPYYNVFSRRSSHPKTEFIIKHYDEIIARMKKDGTIQKVYDNYLK